MTRTERIDLIRTLPEELEPAVAALPAGGLDRPYREGGWTARQVVHHLADSHMNAFIRCKLCLAEEHPVVKTYSQDDWAQMPDATGPVDSSLEIIRGLHARWTTLLNAAGESDWSKSVAHPENGDMSLDRLLEIYSTHGRKHIEHIRSIR
jgi:hypothetical protein